MLKVIFLDVDGVLINGRSCRVRFDNPAAECVAALNDLIARTKAVIVVSSCWRIGRTVVELRELLASWGVVGTVIDRTENLGTKRGKEIAKWLSERNDHRGDVESFVIIDDDSDMCGLIGHLVKTRFEEGLTPERVDAAVAKLSVT